MGLNLPLRNKSSLMTFDKNSGRSPVPVQLKGTIAIGLALSTPPVMTIFNTFPLNSLMYCY